MASAKIIVLLTFSFSLQQVPLSDERVHIRPETLRDIVRFSVPSKQILSTLFMSNYLFTPRA